MFVITGHNRAGGTPLALANTREEAEAWVKASQDNGSDWNFEVSFVPNVNDTGILGPTKKHFTGGYVETKDDRWKKIVEV